MVGSIHRMVQIKEPVLMTARRWGEGWALDVFMTLQSSGIAREGACKRWHSALPISPLPRKDEAVSNLRESTVVGHSQ